MRIEAITYTDNQYFVAYDDEVSEEQIKRELSRNYESLEDVDFLITTREAAEAPHTNNDEDLDTLNDLAKSYDHVDFINVQIND